MTIKSQNLIVWISALWVFMMLMPYFIWPLASYFSFLFTIPLSVIFYRNRNKFKNSQATILFCILCVFSEICAGANIFGIIMCAQVCIIFSAKNEFLADVYSKFRVIFSVLIGLSLISYFLVKAGIPLPCVQFPPPPNNTMDEGVTAYPLYIVPNAFYENGIFAAFRFCGPFDEPGVIGTISLFILAIEKFNLKKIGNIIILIAGIFSYSLFFYAAAFIYLVYYTFFLGKKIFPRLICGALIFGAISYASTDEVMSRLIMDRLEWDKSSNTISGDDRATYECKKYVQSIRGTTKYYFGSQDQNLIAKFNEGASIENVIVKYGAIPLFLFVLFYFFYSKKSISSYKEWSIFMIVFIVILYTRPTMYNYYRLFLQNVMIIAASYPMLFEKTIEPEKKKKWYQFDF